MSPESNSLIVLNIKDKIFHRIKRYIQIEKKKIIVKFLDLDFLTENGEIDNNWLSIPLGFSVFLVQEEGSLEKGLDHT